MKYFISGISALLLLSCSTKETETFVKWKLISLQYHPYPIGFENKIPSDTMANFAYSEGIVYVEIDTAQFTGADSLETAKYLLHEFKSLINSAFENNTIHVFNSLYHKLPRIINDPENIWNVLPSDALLFSLDYIKDSCTNVSFNCLGYPFPAAFYEPYLKTKYYSYQSEQLFLDIRKKWNSDTSSAPLFIRESHRNPTKK